MIDEKAVQFYRILKKHFYLRMSQREIAKSEKLSTATISRMINRAMDEGYVKFTLELPVLTLDDLEQALIEKYCLKSAAVVKTDVDNREIIMKDVSTLVAQHLNKTVQPGDVIGVSWGNTLSSVVNWLKPKKVEGITVVGLNGSVSKNVSDTGADVIIKKLAENYQGVGYSIPLPSFLDNENIVKSIMSDSNIKQLFELIERARIALFSVGSIRDDSVLIRAGYFEKSDYKKLREQGYVGDICSRYFKTDGSFEENALYKRVIGIDLEAIKKKEDRICVVAGKEKAASLHAALLGGYITSLFVDEMTARALMDL